MLWFFQTLVEKFVILFKQYWQVTYFTCQASEFSMAYLFILDEIWKDKKILVDMKWDQSPEFDKLLSFSNDIQKCLGVISLPSSHCSISIELPLGQQSRLGKWSVQQLQWIWQTQKISTKFQPYFTCWASEFSMAHMFILEEIWKDEKILVDILWDAIPEFVKFLSLSNDIQKCLGVISLHLAIVASLLSSDRPAKPARKMIWTQLQQLQFIWQTLKFDQIVS